MDRNFPPRIRDRRWRRHSSPTSDSLTGAGGSGAAAAVPTASMPRPPSAPSGTGLRAAAPSPGDDPTPEPHPPSSARDPSPTKRLKTTRRLCRKTANQAEFDGRPILLKQVRTILAMVSDWCRRCSVDIQVAGSALEKWFKAHLRAGAQLMDEKDLTWEAIQELRLWDLQLKTLSRRLRNEVARTQSQKENEMNRPGKLSWRFTVRGDPCQECAPCPAHSKPRGVLTRRSPNTMSHGSSDGNERDWAKLRTCQPPRSLQHLGTATTPKPRDSTSSAANNNEKKP